MLAFGLAGFALARSRGLWLAVRGSYMAAGILVLSWALPIVHTIIWPYGTPQPARAVAVLPELLVVPLVACLSLVIRPYRREWRARSG